MYVNTENKYLLSPTAGYAENGKSIFTPARRRYSFHFHISFYSHYSHVKTPSPVKTAFFFISTGARPSASCNILSSPGSVPLREPAGRRRRNRGHRADPSAHPDHRYRSRTRQKRPSLHVCKYLIPTVQVLPQPSRRTSQALPPAPLSAAHTPIHAARRIIVAACIAAARQRYTDRPAVPAPRMRQALREILMDHVAVPSPVNHHMVCQALHQLVRRPRPVAVNPINLPAGRLQARSYFIQSHNPFIHTLRKEILPAFHHFLFIFLTSPDSTPTPASFRFSTILSISDAAR